MFSQSSSPPLRLALEREYPLFTSPLLPSSPHLLPLSGRPAAESKVIQIQSDHLLAASLLAGFLFFFLILAVALLHKQPPHLRDRRVTMVLEESLVSFFSPTFSLLLKSVWVASSTSSMCCSFLPGSSWGDTARTGALFFAPRC